MKIKIIKCRNKYFWYREEAKKPLKEKTKFTAHECESQLGVCIDEKGFVYHGDYKIYKR